MSIYKERGYESREEYLKCLAAELDVPLEDVLCLADVLGPNEDFDGLVTGLQDFYGLR